MLFPTLTFAVFFLDAQESLIKTFSSKAPEPEASSKVEQRVPAEAGMNRFIWHMRYPDARLVPGDKLLEDKVGGPLAPPGTYQVRLAVDGDAQTQTFALVKDPRVSASQADFEAQFQFLIAVRDQLSALHDSVNKLRSIRQQVDEWVQRAAGHAAAEAVAKAAGALQEKLSAIEDEVIQVRYKGARDRLDLPAKLNAKLAELTSVVAAADFAPPQQTHDVFQAINGRINLQLGRLEEVLDQDVTGFEHLLRELQIPAIVPRTAP